jgi:signal transduction histidine kinase
MVFLRDASARHAGLRRTQDSLVESERLNARVGIAAEVGHSINGALTVAQAQLQLLVLKRDTLQPEELERRVTQALEHLGRIDTLSKGLMDFSRSQVDLAPARVDRLVEETVKLLQYQRRFARIRIELDLDRRIGEAMMDAAQMRQAVLHLLVNAADAMAEAGHPLRPIVARTRMVGRNVEISVIDAGPGVPERLRERIFEPGYSRRPGGRGFGLSTVRAVARAHHGMVSMWDAPEGGSVFRILFPARPAASRNRPARAPRSRHALAVVAGTGPAGVLRRAS